MRISVKLLRVWNGNAAGSVLELDAPIADLLLARGIAERVNDAPPVASKPAFAKVQPSAVKRGR